MIPIRFDLGMSSNRNARVPNPRDDRNNAFIALPKWRRRRLLRSLFGFLLAIAAAAAFVAVILHRTDVRQLVLDGALDFGVGICRLYVDNGRDILNLNCFRRCAEFHESSH